MTFRISIAPMMGYSDRHQRYMWRLLSKHIWLYTPMISAAALLHGDVPMHLDYSAHEQPLILQLGGSDPAQLAKAVEIAAPYNFQEYNLNVGCPSDRVQQAKMGACLMLEPELVSACVAAMQSVTDKPVTVKTRLGVDERDDYRSLCKFIETVEGAGCQHFILHARKAWLKGLNPKQNRNIPPLCYDKVYQLKKDFAHLNILINGGFKQAVDIAAQREQVDGVMIGREAVARPWLLAELEQLLFASHTAPSLGSIVQQYKQYLHTQQRLGVKLNILVKPLFNIYKDMPGAKQWRRELNELLQAA